MSKRETRRTEDLLRQEQQRVRSQRGAIGAGLNDRLGQARARGDQTRDAAFNALTGILKSGPGEYGRFLGRWGGVDPEIADRIMSSGTELRNWGRNSISAGDQQRFRGGGVYDEFAKSGGVSEAEKLNLRSRGLSGTGAIFEGFRNNLATQGRAQGGYNPGYAGQTAKLARDQARAISDTARDTELGIEDRVRSGRMWGAEGMSQSEAALQDQLARNFLQSFGLAQEGDLGLGDMAQRGAMFGAQGASNRELAAAQGLTDLYGTVPGEESMNLEALLRNTGAEGDEIDRILGRRMQYIPRRTAWGNVGRAAKLIGRGAAAYFTGGGSEAVRAAQQRYQGKQQSRGGAGLGGYGPGSEGYA